MWKHRYNLEKTPMNLPYNTTETIDDQGLDSIPSGERN